mmetsp:Transcript_2877/g.8656  ORF Transcript_2877/g.8656 Transcript_2877/m.8656 type:complete len:237 (-) Transcript_2877:923-1633(-)
MSVAQNWISGLAATAAMEAFSTSSSTTSEATTICRQPPPRAWASFSPLKHVRWRLSASSCGARPRSSAAGLPCTYASRDPRSASTTIVTTFHRLNTSRAPFSDEGALAAEGMSRAPSREPSWPTYSVARSAFWASIAREEAPDPPDDDDDDDTGAARRISAQAPVAGGARSSLTSRNTVYLRSTASAQNEKDRAGSCSETAAPGWTFKKVGRPVGSARALAMARSQAATQRSQTRE